MILCSFVRNDEIIGNTDAISYETKKSGAWRSSCHMPDFFCLVPIFINFRNCSVPSQSRIFQIQQHFLNLYHTVTQHDRFLEIQLGCRLIHLLR